MNMSDVIKDKPNDDLDKSQSKISVFNNFTNLLSNSYHTFVVRKTERLASATYVITGFMPQEEPVRIRLRVCALELITRSTSPSELSGDGGDAFESRCSEISIILQTALHAGLVSRMNAELIAEEYATLAAFVRTHKSKIAEPGHSLRKISVSEPKSLSGSIRQSDKSLLKNGSLNKKTPYKNNVKDLGTRRSVILSLFEDKNVISIKDAVSLIPGVSEKTVQRDLLQLVAEGSLVKEGSRRWTTYKRLKI